MPFLGDNNDPFDEIVREFFGKDLGGTPKRREIVRGSEDRKIDLVEDEKNIYFVLEVPGYSEKDITISIAGKSLNVRISKKEENVGGIPEYMSKRLIKGLSINKTLPENLKSTKFEKTVKNGILEIKFPKKKNG